MNWVLGQWKFLRNATLAALLAGLSLASPRLATAQEEEKTIMSYGVGVVSDYVFRGTDLFTGVYTKNEEEQSAFNLAPAVQPYVNFYSDTGFWVGFWGSWALLERDEDEDTGFAGLSALDELDTTIAYDWSNSLGTYSAGIINYALIHPDPQGTAGANIQEMFFTWVLPVAMNPKLSYYVDSSTANTYTAVTVGGGEDITWGANVGYGSKGTQGVQDVTGTIGYALGGGMAVSGNVAYRPTPTLHGYDSDGKYSSAKDGSEADYPPAIFWLAFSWGGSVTE